MTSDRRATDDLQPALPPTSRWARSVRWFIFEDRRCDGVPAALPARGVQSSDDDWSSTAEDENVRKVRARLEAELVEQRARCLADWNAASASAWLPHR